MNQKDAKSVILNVHIAARPETVFKFLSDPERYRQWTTAQSAIEPRMGGALTIVFGPGPAAVGRIVEWIENRKVAFTWGHGLPGEPERDASQVTITLEETPEGTQVTLVHSGLVEPTAREGTAAGWRHYLSTLSFAASRDEHSAHADRMVDAYFSAWSERDAQARRTMLTSCWSDDGRLLDAYANVQGVDALDAHIANAQRMLGPARLERRGGVEVCHGFGWHSWHVALPNGGTMMRGTNFVQFRPDGKIALVVGFVNTTDGRA